MKAKLFLCCVILLITGTKTIAADKDPDRTSYTISKVDNGDGSYTITANVPDDYPVIYWFSMDGAAGMEPGTEDDYMPGDLRRGQNNQTYHHYGTYWEDRQFYLVNGARMTDTDKVLVGTGKTITVDASTFAKYGKAFRYQAYQTEDDATNHTKELTKVYTNFISFGNVVYVNTDSGNDSNDGLTLSTAKRTLSSAGTLLKNMHSANPGTMNSNVIVVYGNNQTSIDNSSTPFNSISYPQTVTGRYSDYIGKEGIVTCRGHNNSDYFWWYNDIKMEHLTLSGNVTSGSYFQFAHSGNLIVYGAGLIMYNFRSEGNSIFWGTVGCEVPGICICGQKETWPMSLTKQENSTYKVNDFPTGSEIYLLSGYYGRILGAGRSDGDQYSNLGYSFSNNRNIAGVFNHPLETKVVFEIDNEFYTEAQKKAVIQGNKAPTCDVGFVAGGMANGSCFQICDFEIKSAYIHRFVAGGVGWGGLNYTGYVDHFPTDSYFGKSTINMHGGRIDELFGGTMGRLSGGNSIMSFYRGFFYGESNINIYDGTILSNIYAAGCGGTSGIGDDANHTNDLAIPYFRGSTHATYGSISFGSYKEYKASGRSVPSMTSRFFFKNDDNTDYTFSLLNTKAQVNIYGGTIKGNVYGGGYGYSPYLETDNIAWATYLAGCFFGDTYVNISGGEIQGTVYGGGAGADTFNENFSGYNPPNNSYYPYDDAIRSIISAGKFFNHDALGRVFGDTHVTISDSPVITGDIYAGASGINSKSTYRKATNSTYTHNNNPYKEMAMVVGNTNLEISGGTISGNVYGGGQSASVSGNTNLTITGGTITGKIFGGGQGIDQDHVNTGTKTYIVAANVGGNSTVNITGGSVTDIYGSNNYFGVESGNTNINIDAGTVNGSVFGGGYGSQTNVEGNTDVQIGKAGNETSPTVTGDVYGGSALGKVNTNTDNSSNVTIQEGSIGGNVYGGGLGSATIASPVNGNINVTLNGGSITGNVFGGNNVNGSALGDIVVNTNITTENTYSINNIYGGGNLAAYSPTDTSIASPAVNVQAGKVSGNVFGGGLGSSAVVTANPTVTISGDTVVGNVFGGGDLAVVTGDPSVSVVGGVVKAKVFGGGNKASIGSSTVSVSGGTVSSGVYGGCNTSGTATDAVVNVTGGTIGADGALANVHGGGYGPLTDVTGDVSVTVGSMPAGTDLTANKENISDYIIYGDVYGGSALGKTNTGVPKTTSVKMYSGTVSGNVYGGALGDVDSAATVGAVSQAVDIYGGKVTGSVYGGSNINATMTNNPQLGVTIYDTYTPTASGDYAIGNVFGGGNGETAADAGQPGAHSTNADGTYVTVKNGYIGKVFGGGNAATVLKGTVNIDGGTIGSVFGGGNLANVVSSGSDDGTTVVNINNCDVTVGSVYGGCNAADIASNATTTIWGGTIDDAFAGGNGVKYVDASNPGTSANVGGNALLTIHGGTIGRAFAGSNNQGTITGSMDVVIDQQANGTNAQCTETIDEVYGGGNLAKGKAGTITIDCNSGTIGDVYGGANQADITGDIALNIVHGTIGRVFGGNNTSGNIAGSITVNINKDNECSTFSVGNVYGGGNKAPYKAPTTDSYTGLYPAVNILAGTVTEDVFGGGLGKTAIVTGTPTVIINGGTVSRDVYGGGSQASVTGNTAVTLTSGTVAGNIYGGGLGQLDDQATAEDESIAANVSGTTTVTVDDGQAANVFGCNNLYGAPETAATVSVTGGSVTSNVYGGGNLAAASVSPYVMVTGGSMNNVYGGGLGATAVVTGNPTVSINKPAGSASSLSVQNIFGGGDQAVTTGNTTINLATTSGKDAPITGNVYGGGNLAEVQGNTTINAAGGSAAKIFGGGNGNVTDSKAADITGNTSVLLTGTAISGGLYGGCNAMGTVNGNTSLSLTGGSVGTSALAAEGVFGGGYGQQTGVNGNVDVLLNGTPVYGDVYGGSALGSVNNGTEDHTYVTLNSGNVWGNIYGGGLGRKDDTTTTDVNESVAAVVNGPVVVTMNGGKVTGDIFGCNNLNGAPASTVKVDINATDAHVASPLTYAVRAVYGGGNEAVYAGTPAVNINDCAVSIGSVYGGGNAASTKGTNATIWGGTIESAFGGGNGQVKAADVDGNSSLTIHGGKIASVYAGSNTSGNITGTMALNIDQQPRVASGDACPQEIGEVYGGGNQAEGKGAVITIGCGTGYLGNVYGGSRAAKINGDLTLNIKGGQIDNVFGGNNESGDIAGDITVNINTGGCSDAWIKNVYGGGNLAAFGHNTTVNLISGTVGRLDTDGVTVLGGNVFGGGYGASAKVTGNTTVNLCSDAANPTKLFSVLGSIYGGGDLASVEGNTTLNLTKGTTKYAFGGGNKADVTGNTKVTLNGTNAADVTVSSDLYGGGSLASVSGGTDVELISGTVSGNVYGGGLGQVASGDAVQAVAANVGTSKVELKGATVNNVFGSNNVNGAPQTAATVTVYSGTVTGNVYGGGNLAAAGTDSAPVSPAVTVTGGSMNKVYGGGLGQTAVITGNPTVTINKATSSTMTVTDVFGGGDAASVTGSPTININAGTIANAYGGGYGAATNVTGLSTVSLNGAIAVVTGDIYGGSALGSVTGTAVTITDGTVTGSVYGGGLGDADNAAAVNGDVQVTVDGGKISGNVYGCNNVNGAPVSGSTVNVDINATGSNTIPAVFGGGNMASYEGTPHVSVNTSNALIGKVFGGGNAANVSGTDVTIWGGTVGDAFAGGNGVVASGSGDPGVSANVNGDALLTIHGGTITRAFAGSNNQGSITGSQSVMVDNTAKSGGTLYAESVKELYGGGNLAAGKAGTISIDCTANNIDDVYGGANQADITGNIVLNITKGQIKRVFGGNNTSGSIAGSITVNINKDTDCNDFHVDNVYGGGNLAPYSAPAAMPNYPAVNILAGTVTEDVFGGGLGTSAIVTGTPTVIINGGTVSRDVYGGGSQASVTGNTAVTLTSGTVAGNIYGGGLGSNTSGSEIAANVSGTTTVSVTGGTAANVFGCNNLYGAPETAATVSVTGGSVTSNVYGGGNLAAASVSPYVMVTGGSMNNVYGGGLGATAVVTGNPTVSINKPAGSASSLSVQNIFGGGDQAVTTGNTTINLTTTSGNDAPVTGNVYGGGNLAEVQGNTTINAAGGSAAKIFGGGNGNVTDNKAANITGNTSVLLTGTAISGGLYGGCNAMGAVNGNTSLSLTSGSVGTSALAAEGVFGGGYGQQTGVNGNVDVVLNGTSVYGDVYGGSALGSVNSGTDDYTHVTLESGTVNGNIYGGGLGRKDDTTTTDVDESVAAVVNGPVVVTMNGGKVTGDIFGCNNLNGAPASTVQVDINATDAHVESPLTYAVRAVYGGGNEAAYSGTPAVNINDCEVSIGSVYGGGNAASTKGTNATIWGGTIESAFGGGNGQVKAADVDGNSSLTIHGGKIASVYAGSNTSGTISGTMALNIDQQPRVASGDACPQEIGEVYGGGNQAEGKGAVITIGCGTGYLGNVYGGSRAAKINGDLTLNIKGGQIDNVFGGNNVSGDITGGITVNIDIAECPTAKIKNVYGGGNLAPYTAPVASGDYPVVNLISGTVGWTGSDGKLLSDGGGNVFGGGLGASAVVNGNPVVNLVGYTSTGTDDTNGPTRQSTVLGRIYGGGDLAPVTGNTTLNLTKGTTAYAFGGGNKADVTGNTKVTLNGADAADVTVSSYIYGGGSLASVSGGTDVELISGTVSGSVYGGGLGQASGDATPAIAANVGTSKVELKGATVNNIFGCNNVNGAPQTSAVVTVASGEVTGNVYGGGNLAAASLSPVVSLTGGTVTGDVFGAGLGASAVITGDPTVTVNGGTVSRDVYGGGSQASVKGNTSVAMTTGSVGGNIYGGGLGKTAVGDSIAANVSGTATVNVNGGTVTGSVFGCNNLLGAPAGVATVTVDMESGSVNGNVYGGGNQAAYTGSATVNLTQGTVAKAFGGGYGATAIVTGDPTVNLTGATVGNVFGGGDEASLIGNPQLSVSGGQATQIFGGGNKALVTGNPAVSVAGGTHGTVFGGGNEANVDGTPTVTVTGASTHITGNVFGGGNQGNVSGSPTVTIGQSM